MKYTAINIGPIIKTLDMARKPRELWAASFLFSQLMKHLYAETERHDVEIISPAKPKDEKTGVGIYPDRLFIKGEIDANSIINNAQTSFKEELAKACDKIDDNAIEQYLNIMSIGCTAEKDSEAIASLNQKLDVMELCQYANDGNVSDAIYKILHGHSEHLMTIASADKRIFWRDLEEIAHYAYDKEPCKEQSHHRYICIVQADGDNVGKTVSHKLLKNGDVKKISEALVSFGMKATKEIKGFGGTPIYAGGDDLLFIAPVVGEGGRNIFDLIETLQNDSFKDVREIVHSFGLNNDKGKIEASLSFGVSITYHKYPLYEAFDAARNLLFGTAKNIDGKKAIAWSLRKHSGGTFDASFTCNGDKLWEQYKKLIAETKDGNTVSAVAHKLRQNEALVNIVLETGDEKRLDALFDKLLEFDSKKSGYFNAVKTIMPTLYKVVGKDNYIKTLYGMLRTAKFIKGEDLRDE